MTQAPSPSTSTHPENLLNAVNGTASGALLTGLATIFLPMTQSLPQHVTTGAQEISTLSGIALIAVTLVGRLWHHVKLSSLVTVATDPAVEARLSNVEQALSNYERSHP